MIAPVQIRTSASTHTALTKDEWRRSVRQDKDAGREVGEPIGSTGGKSFPPHLCSLTAPDEDIPPQQVDTSLKDAQLGRVAGHSMVLVITQHNSAKPCTDCGRAIMLPALKLSLDGFQLRDHPLLRRDPPDDECSITDAPPTEVSKTQERKGLCFPLRAVSGCERRTARTRSVVSYPDVIPSRTLPDVPGTLSGNARHQFGAENPPQDCQHNGRLLRRPLPLSCARHQLIDRRCSADTH